MTQISKKQIYLYIGLYFGFRIFSYFFSPTTPLYHANPINWIFSTAILLAVIYFLLKKDIHGWLFIASGLILGGSGNLLEVKGVSLRTLLLLFSITIFTLQKIKDKELFQVFRQNKLVVYLLSFIFFAAGMAAVRGYQLGNDFKLIFADTIPYLFFLYYFPLTELLKLDKFRKAIFNMLLVAVVSNFVFTYFTLAGFASHLFVLQDSYYHWFRDVAGGKITDYNTGFFRILLNEQLLLVPVFLWVFAKQINENTKKLAFKIAGAALLAVLTVNITRIYLVALAVGILFLFSIKNWRRWLAYSAGAAAFFVIVFSLTNLAATKGKSFGWEYLGLRLQSIAMPQTEDSSLSRLLLLPKIIEKIKSHPLLGSGLGSAITVYSPIFKANITTPHFDWGYLEIFVETGIIGAAAWGALISYLLLKTKQNRGLLAPVIALLVINFTSPALFHVLGIILIVYLLARNTLKQNITS